MTHNVSFYGCARGVLCTRGGPLPGREPYAEAEALLAWATDYFVAHHGVVASHDSTDDYLSMLGWFSGAAGFRAGFQAWPDRDWYWADGSPVRIERCMSPARKIVVLVAFEDKMIVNDFMSYFMGLYERFRYCAALLPFDATEEAYRDFYTRKYPLLARLMRHAIVGPAKMAEILYDLVNNSLMERGVFIVNLGAGRNLGEEMVEDIVAAALRHRADAYGFAVYASSPPEHWVRLLGEISRRHPGFKTGPIEIGGLKLFARRLAGLA